VITLRGYQIDIAVQLPSDMKNKGIRGLLGNYNGVASDDLISRTGQSVDANANEETIYYDFGETCELMSPLCSKPQSPTLTVLYLVEICMGMGFPVGTELPWDSHGNGREKHISWEWEEEQFLCE